MRVLADLQCPRRLRERQSLGWIHDRHEAAQQDVTRGLERAAARGMLHAVGMSDEDFPKPQIGVASSWNEITPYNLSFERLARSAKEGVHAAGVLRCSSARSRSRTASRWVTGMHFSLVSREIIADSTEAVWRPSGSPTAW